MNELFQKLLRKYRKDPEIPQYVFSYTGKIIEVDDDVIVALPKKTFEGIARVVKLDPEKNMALVEFYPYLSPAWKHGVNWYPGQMLRHYEKDIEEA